MIECPPECARFIVSHSIHFLLPTVIDHFTSIILQQILLLIFSIEVKFDNKNDVPEKLWHTWSKFWAARNPLPWIPESLLVEVKTFFLINWLQKRNSKLLCQEFEWTLIYWLEYESLWSSSLIFYTLDLFNKIPGTTMLGKYLCLLPTFP